MTASASSRIGALKARLKADRKLAHRHVFAHRHPDPTPEFHNRVIDLWSEPNRKTLTVAFRGAAKSTLSEEDVALDVLTESEIYTLLIGSSYERACERLESVRHEIETNEIVLGLYGDQKGPTWTENELVLKNGHKIQAFGRGQSLRGAKHHHHRPSRILADDLEDDETIDSEEVRRKMMRWIMGAVRPMLSGDRGSFDIIGSEIHTDGLIARLRKTLTWKSLVIPLRVVNPDTGDAESAWPGRFSLKWITDTEEEYARVGNSEEFEREYLCNPPELSSAKLYRQEMITIKAEPYPRGPVSIVIDPARTVGKRSSQTGYAAAGWKGSRLGVFEAYGAWHKPDEILDTIFALNKRFAPVWIYIEEVGLEQWIGQPLRAEMVKRGIALPVKAIRAPRDKDSFIQSLYPFYYAREVEHYGEFPDLVGQLLAHPKGLKDVSNALAYFTKSRPGQPVYPDFSQTNIEIDLELAPRATPIVCIAARGNTTVAMLVQNFPGSIHVIADWIRDEPPQACFDSLKQDIALEIRSHVWTFCIPPEQWDRYRGVGLPATVQRANRPLMRGFDLAGSQDALKPFIRRNVQGNPGLLVSSRATATINGLYEGYGRRYNESGQLEDAPEDNRYSCLIGALESFAAWLGSSDEQLEDDGRRFRETPDGRRYLTSDPRGSSGGSPAQARRR